PAPQVRERLPTLCFRGTTDRGEPGGERGKPSGDRHGERYDSRPTLPSLCQRAEGLPVRFARPVALSVAPTSAGSEESLAESRFLKRQGVLGVDLNRSESRWGRADPSCAVTQMIADTIPRETFPGSCGCDHERAPTAAQVRSAQPCQFQGIVVAF